LVAHASEVSVPERVPVDAIELLERVVAQLAVARVQGLVQAQEMVRVQVVVPK
jgi:hypothetical protein